ncbi:uncharacterized protein P884DRAFT_269113 [Thermothelomyces heterothallicus CBS 202.75]|uniref:uncharacterized protein n=1 Tax=Thermothelomyces heterothallicus CBS 202.75 TaxID=1149848 RepID=UPI003741F0B3
MTHAHSSPTLLRKWERYTDVERRACAPALCDVYRTGDASVPSHKPKTQTLARYPIAPLPFPSELLPGHTDNRSQSIYYDRDASGRAPGSVELPVSKRLGSLLAFRYESVVEVFQASPQRYRRMPTTAVLTFRVYFDPSSDTISLLNTTNSTILVTGDQPYNQ